MYRYKDDINVYNTHSYGYLILMEAGFEEKYKLFTASLTSVHVDKKLQIYSN